MCVCVWGGGGGRGDVFDTFLYANLVCFDVG